MNVEQTNNFFIGKEYHKIWESVQFDLKRIIHGEDDLQKEGEIEDWHKEYKILGCFYLQYIKAINKLDECYDRIVHPQKRILIRKLMDACLCRFLEVKHRMVQLNMDDINVLDNTSMNEKIVPFDAEINIPAYYTRDSKYARKELKHLFEKFLKNAVEHEAMVTEDPLTFTKAILIIQKHERVRQALKKYDYYYRLMRLRELGKYPSLAQDDGSILTKSAEVIQKTWRGYKCRKAYLKRKTELMVLMGIVPPMEYSGQVQKENYEKKIAHHQIQRQREARFHQAIPGDKPRQILRKRRRMLTTLRNKDRVWYHQNVLFRRRPSFVEFDEGHPPAKVRVEEKLGERRFVPKKPKVNTEALKKKKKKGKKKEKDGGEKGKPAKEEKKNTGPLERPVMRKQLIWEAQEYKKLWQRKDESLNFHQLHNLHPIIQRNLKKLRREVKKVVDDLMLLELQRLQNAIKEYHSKKKKKKKKGGKKKKGKGKKKGGKKKGKKGKGDLTGDRTFESLFEEMVMNGVIRSYPEVCLSSFAGEQSFFGQEMEAMGKVASTSLGDIRKLVKEYCILPLGSAFVHQNAPFVKSLLITGPHESGKHLLLNAICTETQAFLFDISNERISEKYPDKESLKILVHLVTKMSRLLQPSIIFFDNAEKAFIKKVPKNDTSNPRRLGKILPKLSKGIKPSDRIMLIGISKRPFDAKQRGLNKTYQKFLYIPRPNYANISQHWADTLYTYGRLNYGFDYHTMAKLSDGYTLNSISRVISNQLTCLRMLTVGYKSLKPQEFFKNLSEEVAVYNEEETAYLKWFSKCPLGKKKQKYLKQIEEEQNAKKGKKK